MANAKQAYKVVDLQIRDRPAQEVEDELNALGDQEWELVIVFPDDRASYSPTVRCMFRKQK